MVYRFAARPFIYKDNDKKQDNIKIIYTIDVEQGTAKMQTEENGL